MIHISFFFLKVEGSRPGMFKRLGGLSRERGGGGGVPRRLGGVPGGCGSDAQGRRRGCGKEVARAANASKTTSQRRDSGVRDHW